MQRATKCETVADVVEALGGLTKVGKLTKRAPQHVWNWRKQGRFPGRLYLVMTRALAAAGHKAPDSLWQEIHTED